LKLTISGEGKNNLRGKKKFLKFNTWENICPCDYPLPFIKKTEKKEKKEKIKKRKQKEKKRKKQKTKLKKKKKSSDSHTNVYRCTESVIIKKETT
jgi:hypothetical protein